MEMRNQVKKTAAAFFGALLLLVFCGVVPVTAMAAEKPEVTGAAAIPEETQKEVAPASTGNEAISFFCPTCGQAFTVVPQEPVVLSQVFEAPVAPSVPVLSARMASTGDNSNTAARMAVIFAMAAVVALLTKKENI